MTSERPHVIRDNAFLIAAIALPLIVAAFFVLATAIPRWTVAPPAYDFVFRAPRYYETSPAKVAVEFVVRDGRVDAVTRRAADGSYPQRWTLFLFDHSTMRVREVPVDLPDALDEGESRTIPVAALAGRRVVAETIAPDGYEASTRSNGGRGIVGELFGMGGYRQTMALVNKGRAVPLTLPAPFHDAYAPISPVGWIVDQDR